MGDIIISMLEAIFGGSFASGADGLRNSVAEYNADVFTFANTVNSTVVKPVAAVIVAIILTLELAKLSSRVEGDHQLGVQMVASVLIKATLVVIAIQNADLILRAINEVGEKLIGGVADVDADTGSGVSDAVKTAVNDLGTVEQAGLLLVLFLPWLLGIAASIALKIIVFVRFAEVYILSAAVTLPLSFLGHTETKGIAIGYLKRYGTVILQGFVIFLIIAIYNFFNVASVDLSGVTGDNIIPTITGNIGQLLIAPLFFLFLLFSSSRMAKALVGEG